MVADMPGAARDREPLRRRVWRWLVRVAAVISAVVLVAFAVLAVVILDYGTRDRAQPADTIVVLGGGTTGTPRRALHAAALYAQGYAPYVVCTGGTETSGVAEGRRCASALRAQGVPAAAIVVEARSLSTEENAIQVQRIMARRGWQSAVLVSDDYHLWRARWLFDERGITVYPSPAQRTTGALGFWEKSQSVLREIAAVGWQVGKTALGLPQTHTPLVIIADTHLKFWLEN